MNLNYNIPKFLLLILFILIFQNSISQKLFSTVIEFPKDFQSSNINILYYNGLAFKPVSITNFSNKITLSDSYTSSYVTIIIDLDSHNNCLLPTHNIFYVSNNPSKISFVCNISNRKMEKRYKLYNAVEATSINNEFIRFTSKERVMANKLTDSISKLTVLDSNSLAKNKMLIETLINKEIKFIKHHENLYYSFEIFKSQIATSQIYNPITSNKIFHEVFSLNQRTSSEGKAVEALLLGKIILNSKSEFSPTFKTKDIYGKQISSIDYKGKYLIMHFWASWCLPCIAEMPALKLITDKYPPSKLELISISFDKDSTLFLNSLKKFKIRGYNIYRDINLANLFGGLSTVPMLYLIDPNNKIIYNRNKDQDYKNLQILNFILDSKLK